MIDPNLPTGNLNEVLGLESDCQNMSVNPRRVYRFMGIYCEFPVRQEMSQMTNGDFCQTVKISLVRRGVHQPTRS
jgi:hypothetical protein